MAHPIPHGYGVIHGCQDSDDMKLIVAGHIRVVIQDIMKMDRASKGPTHVAGSSPPNRNASSYVWRANRHYSSKLHGENIAGQVFEYYTYTHSSPHYTIHIYLNGGLMAVTP